MGTVNPNTGSFTPATIQVQAFDVAGRVVNTQFYDSASTFQGFTQNSYDAAGRLLCVATRMNPAAFASAPDACTLGTQGPNGPDRITHYIHESAGLEDRETNGWGTGLQQDTVHYTHTTNGDAQKNTIKSTT